MLRLFPVLRRAWALRGTQAQVAITGRNAKRVLFGALNLRTGHRVVLRRPNRQQTHCRLLLRRLRQAYPGAQMALLLEAAPGHRAAKSRALAAHLNIVLVWLPKQCAALKAMDHLWRDLKSHSSAHYQYPTIDAHAAAAEQWLLSLTPTDALRKAGILAKNFWLQSFIK